MFSVFVLSQSWIVSSFGIVLTIASNVLFYLLFFKMKSGVLIPQQVFLAIILICVTYFCEMKYKHEFMRLRYNMRLKNEFKHVVDVMPEAIVFYEG
jgi:hypothetical protein